MPCEVYQENGICVRNHCGTEPPRDIEPPGLVTTVGGRDRASASYAAADRVKAPASAARGRFRGIHGGCTAPSLPAEARTASGGGCLAGSIPPVLVRSRGCSRTPPRPRGSVSTNEKEDQERTTRPKPRTRQVGVGIMIAHKPLHGSGRAELTHPALALGDDAHAALGNKRLHTRTARYPT